MNTMLLKHKNVCLWAALAYALSAPLQAGLISNGGIHQLRRRNSNAFLINRSAKPHRSRILPAHIGVMCTRSHIENRRLITVNEDREHHSDVRKMRSSRKWVVKNRDISRAKRQRVHRCLHRHRHSIAVGRFPQGVSRLIAGRFDRRCPTDGRARGRNDSAHHVRGDERRLGRPGARRPVQC